MLQSRQYFFLNRPSQWMIKTAVYSFMSVLLKRHSQDCQMDVSTVLCQERINQRDLISHTSLIPKVIPLKLFLDSRYLALPLISVRGG